MESWKFKVVTFGLVFETGTMAGLMTKKGDTLRFILTLGYLTLNLALFGSWRALAECEETGVRRALEGPGVPVGRRNGVIWHWLGPGNTNIPLGGTGWVLPGIPPSQYPPACTTPGTHLTGQHEGYTGRGNPRDMHI